MGKSLDTVKNIFGRVGTFVWKLILLTIIIVLVLLLIHFGKLAYIETNSSAAKAYIDEKYEFDEDEYQATEYIAYVYSDLADCSNLWFKECTDDENLAFKYVFESKDKNKTIIVLEDKSGSYTDDYTE